MTQIQRVLKKDDVLTYNNSSIHCKIRLLDIIVEKLEASKL
jgi:hypothetical protein